MDRYDCLVSDHPDKMTPEEANFREANSSRLRCASCIHWYRGLEHDVCEVMRPPDEQVPWNYVCDFWTVGDGQHPLHKEPAHA